MELYPIVALVPRHSMRLEIIHEVDRREGMLAKTHNAKSFVDYGHGDGWSPSHDRLQQLVAMTRENEHTVALEANKVVVVVARGTVDLILVRDFFHDDHRAMRADNE